MTNYSRDAITDDYVAAIGRARGRQEAADLYADGLVTYGTDGLNWQRVNAAVITQWSKSALIWIKRVAWASLKEKPGGKS